MSEECDGDCRYRRLYEGTLLSLSDMSSVQRASASRLGALRTRVAALLEQNFPADVRAAERAGRFSLRDLPDEQLVSFAERLLASRAAPPAPADDGELASALASAGVPVSPSRPDLWAQQIGTLVREGWTFSPPQEVSADPATQAPPAPAPAPAPDDAPVRSAGAAVGPAAGSVLAPPEPRPLILARPQGPSTPAPAPADPAAKGGSHAPTPPPQAKAAPEVDADAKGSSWLPAPQPDLRDSLRGPTVTRPAVEAAPPPASPPAAEPPVRGDGPSGQSDDTAPGTSEERKVDLPSHATPATDVSSLFQPPLRPELVQQPKRPRKRRQSRTRRVADLDVPDFSSEDASDAAPAPDPDLSSKLLAAVTMSRPTFTRDLVAVAGSVAALDAWEEACRSDPSSSPVRFIAPKARHRMRGRLVVVDSAGPSDPAEWWPRCVDRYRAGRLYELAVVLDSVADEVVSLATGEHVVTVRLAGRGTLRGLVVSLDSDASAAPDEIESALGTLVGERLDSVALLTASADRQALETLSAAVSGMVRARSWRPSMPLVVARSWEYADDPRAASVLVQV